MGRAFIDGSPRTPVTVPEMVRDSILVVLYMYSNCILTVLGLYSDCTLSHWLKWFGQNVTNSPTV